MNGTVGTRAKEGATCTHRAMLGDCLLSTYERGEDRLCYWHRKQAVAAAAVRRPGKLDLFALVGAA